MASIMGKAAKKLRVTETDLFGREDMVECGLAIDIPEAARKFSTDALAAPEKFDDRLIIPGPCGM